MPHTQFSVADVSACTIRGTIVDNNFGVYAARASSVPETRGVARQPRAVAAGLKRITMGKLTTHVLDLAAGTPAAGVRIELHDLSVNPPRLLAQAQTNEDGRCANPLLQGSSLHTGHYSLTFHVAEYFRSAGAKLPAPPFIDEVVIRFGVASPEEHYHIPLLVSPWSYSTYRGS